MADIVLFATKN